MLRFQQLEWTVISIAGIRSSTLDIGSEGGSEKGLLSSGIDFADCSEILSSCSGQQRPQLLLFTVILRGRLAQCGWRVRLELELWPLSCSRLGGCIWN